MVAYTFRNENFPRKKSLHGAIVIAMSGMTMFTLNANAQQRELEEVIVTAQKKDDTLQTVPMTVNAVTADTISKYNLLDFKDIQNVTPGLTIRPQDTRTATIAMRGVNVLTDTGFGPGVAIYWNEVNYDIDSAFMAMYDIGQIEVLRGPQGTLRGITAPAGAVTITSKGPSFSEIEGTVEQTLGEHGLSNTQFGVSLPLIEDKLAMRVAGLYDYNRNSGIENITTGQTNRNMTRSGRLTLGLRPADGWEVTLVHQYLEGDNSGSEAVIGCPSAVSDADGCLNKSDRNSIAPGPGEIAFKRRADTALRIEGRIGDYDFASITGYRDQDNTQARNKDQGDVFENPTLPNAQQGITNIHTFTQELRLSSSDADFYNWTYGLYGSRLLAHNVTTQTGGATVNPLYPASRNYNSTAVYVTPISEEYAVFTNQSFAFTDDLEAQIGVRYQSKRSVTQSIGSTIVCSPTVCPLRTIPIQFPLGGGAAKAVDEGITGTASVSYQLTDDIRTYVTYGRSFRSGGFTVAPQSNPELSKYEPETSDSIELGFKSRLADGRLQINGDIYYQKYHDFLGRTQEGIVSTRYVNGVASSNPAPGEFLNFNADAVVSGAELQIDALLTDDWRAGIGVSYTDAKYTDGKMYCNVRNGAGAIIPPSGGAIVNYCDANGRLAGEPNWSATASSEYTMHFGAVDAFTRGLYTFSSGRSDDSVRGSVLDTSSYGLFNLFIGVRDPRKVWEVSAWAKNLFDHEQVVRIGAPLEAGNASASNVPGANGGGVSGFQAVQLVPERQFGITGKYNFSL